jgi:hypothetical protein
VILYVARVEHTAVTHLATYDDAQVHLRAICLEKDAPQLFTLVRVEEDERQAVCGDCAKYLGYLQARKIATSPARTWGFGSSRRG